MSEKEIPKIHTLEGDLASTVRDENYGRNIIKIITGANKKTVGGEMEGSGSPVPNSKNSQSNIYVKIIIFAIIFILIASAGVVYFIFKGTNSNPADENTNGVDSGLATTSKNKPIVKGNGFLNPEIIQSADFTNLNRNQIIVEINKIRDLLISKEVKRDNNIEISTNIDVATFFEKIQYSGDDSLIRSFDPDYAFGLYSLDNKNFETYLIVKINNFDLAFKSILDWENFMMLDLKNIFIGNNTIDESDGSVSPTPEAISKTSTLSGTSTVKYLKTNTAKFIDRVVDNNDVREYVNNENSIDIIYGFINNNFLLITSGESSFVDIKKRLLKENIVR